LIPWLFPAFWPVESLIFCLSVGGCGILRFVYKGLSALFRPFVIPHLQPLWIGGSPPSLGPFFPGPSPSLR
jgi:hypothetical protein